jgi:hypothetical protein
LGKFREAETKVKSRGIIGGRKAHRPRGATVPPRSASWPEPQAVPRSRPPVPAFDAALLPDALAPWVADIAERVQCPPDFVAVGVLVAARCGDRSEGRDSSEAARRLGRGAESLGIGCGAAA